MSNDGLKITLREKVGQLFFPAAFINDTDENIQKLETLIKKNAIGGLTFFHSRLSAATNYEGKKEVVYNDNSLIRLRDLIIKYQSISKFPLLISIDAEWGLAMRVEKTPQYPYAITLGALAEADHNLIFEVGKNIGNDLKNIGIDYNLAPVADINDNPKNPVIGYRSFGADRNNVAKSTIEYCNGLKFSNVLSCLKHFPGHGNTAVDSHLGLPVITKTIAEMHSQELFPFKEAIDNNDVDSIMIGHLAVPALTNGKIISATLSTEIIQELLRKQLGYKGLIISDALNMHSVSKLYDEKGLLEWKAFEAGNDVLCFSENVEEGIEMIIKNGTNQRINESYERIYNLKNKVNLYDTVSKYTGENLSYDFKTAEILNQKIADKVIAISKNEIGLLPLKSDSKNVTVSIYNTNNSVFCNAVAEKINTDFIEIRNQTDFNISELIQNIEQYDTIIVALFVPSVKPLNNFEIDLPVINLLEKLFENSKVVVCFFGNPYAITTISNHDKLKTLIHGYQHFDSFQLAAAGVLTNN